MPVSATIKGIPVYEALVNGEDTGMLRISLVDEPATLVAWQAFAEKRPQLYAVADEDKRIVRGVIMRAEFPIYRRDSFGEYYMIYHADTIREMAEKYLADSRQNNVDTNHDGKEIDGVQMVQWFIKDTAAGIDPRGFDADIADGSLFAEFHVTDEAIWAQIKDGTFNGFSLEGLFAVAPEQDQRSLDEIVDELAGQFHITDMSKIERIKELLRAENARQAQRPEKFGAITTDRGPLEWDGDEDLKAGDRVYIVDEDGNRTDAPDGDYKTEDGKTIAVADGAVAEIRDPEAEVATEFRAARVKMEESYDEKYRLIADAIREKLGDEDFYIVEAGDDFAVIDRWNEEEGEKFYRFSVTWREDGTAEVSDPVEVKPAFVPVGEDTVQQIEEAPEVEELRSQLNAAQARIATLQAQLEAARKRPVAKPAHEEVKESVSFRATGNTKLDRVGQLMAAK